MSVPPNRVGAIRGPNGSTLDDVVSVLGQIRDRLDQSDIRLTNIEALLLGVSNELTRPNTGLTALLATTLARLTFLTGTSAPAATGFGTSGLPGYLSFVLGARSQFGDAGETIWIQNATLSLFVAELLNQLRPSPGVDNSTSYVRLMQEALKREGELPADTSIFRLLASIDTNVAQIEECACGGSNGGGGNQNPPPPNGCLFDITDELDIRVQAWENLGPANPGFTRWGAIWPLAQIQPSILTVDPTVSGADDWFGFFGTAGDVKLCYTWDTTGEGWAGVLRLQNSAPGNFGQGSYVALPGFDLPAGQFATTVGVQQAGNIALDVENGFTPGLNFFLSYGRDAT